MRPFHELFEGLETLSWPWFVGPLWGPSSNHPLCGWYMIFGRCFRVVDLLCYLGVFEEQHDPSNHEGLWLPTFYTVHTARGPILCDMGSPHKASNATAVEKPHAQAVLFCLTIPILANPSTSKSRSWIWRCMPAGCVIPPACCTSVPPPLSRNAKKGACPPARASGGVEARTRCACGGRVLPCGRAGETARVTLRA